MNAARALPESTYQLLLDAAWIPDPGDPTRCLDWTYAELAGMVTRIANALTGLGVRRADAVTLSSVNTSMLYAATLAAQAVGIAAPVNPALSGERIAELIRRTGSRVLVAAGPELDPQLWQRLLSVARQAGMAAILALRPDGAHGAPATLGGPGDVPCASGREPVVAYLDVIISGPAVFAGYVTDPRLGGPRVSRDGVVRDGWLDTGDLGRIDADGFVYLTGRARDLIIRGGHNIDPRVIEEALLAHPAVRAAAAVGRPDRHTGEVPVAYVVPAGPARLDEAELLAWAAAAIGEPAARPRHIYPVDANPVTVVGKQFKPALAADAAVRAVTEALAAAGLPDARATAAHEDGRLVITVAGADPGRVGDAVAGFALTVRSGLSPTPQTAAHRPAEEETGP
jgi:acyl-CoA synthetase (AMP-forming)/AMP-acid ligase II